MPDIVDIATRSRMMAGIRGKNTKPELALRTALHAIGFRYRLHCADLPGKPDLVFPKYRAVVFVNGCFWHGHGCKFFRLPGTRPKFWEKKISGNRERDRKVRILLENAGWHHLTIWECAMRGKGPDAPGAAAADVAEWLQSLRSKTVRRTA